MSNLEVEPDELVCENEGVAALVQILEPREVPLGGPRAMTVRRTLPQRERSLVGAWCFLDHYGPDPIESSGGMTVPPHPHTGLQTVSWLFSGEIEHRDSTGAHALVVPGELNLMTAGRGIQHSEVSTERTTLLHGAQLWVALPDADRHVEPFFERYRAEPFEFQGATIRVFLGELLDRVADASAFSGLVGAQLDLEAQASIRLPVDADFEHALLIDSGAASLHGTRLEASQLGFVPTGQSTLEITAHDEPVRALLIGGTPLDEQIVMWWNFVGRSHDEVAAYREQWQDEIARGGDPAGRFGVTEYDGRALPAPTLPNIRLRPRE